MISVRVSTRAVWPPGARRNPGLRLRYTIAHIAATNLDSLVSRVGGGRRAPVVRSGSRGQLRALGLGLILPLVLLAAWQISTSEELVDTRVVPSPGAVLDAFEHWIFGPRSSLAWESGTWLEYLGQSTKRVMVGFGIASIAGIVLGALIGWYTYVGATIDPLLQWLRPVPVVAWLPFVTLIFGITETSAITLIAMGSFFPVLLNTTAGVRGTRQVLIRAALMLGTSPRRLLLKVALPSALPNITTGLRLSLGLAWVLVIVAEFIGVEGGLGYALWVGFQHSRQDVIIADIITLGALGLISDQIIRTIARHTIHWSKEY
jgi:NitT/TauT family transport system permease protein